MSNSKYDVFISHASEDKVGFVAQLADELRSRNLSVWYDDFTLELGDSLSDSINQGIVESTFGLVVLSPNFFSKQWPKRELASFMAREDNGEKVILPIWHNLTKQDILKEMPLLADRLAGNSDDGLKSLVNKIVKVVKKSPRRFDPNSLPVTKFHISIGILKYFNQEKGFGFIQGESSCEEYFFHKSGLEKNVDVVVGQKVAFLLLNSTKGLNAMRVRPI